MNKVIVFSFRNDEREGGWDDFDFCVGSVEEAKNRLSDQLGSYHQPSDWTFQIVESNKLVSRGYLRYKSKEIDWADI